MVAMAAICVAAPVAVAEDIGIADFSTELNEKSAGMAADFNLKFGVKKSESYNAPSGIIREQVVDLPPGVVGDPTAVTETCPMGDVSPGYGRQLCPPGSVAGFARITIFNPSGGEFGPITVRVYRTEPYPGEIAAFAFTTLLVNPVRLSVTVDPSNGYRVRITSKNQQAGSPLVKADVTMWGVPQEHQGPGSLFQFVHPDTFGGPMPAGIERRRFMSVPTRCDGPLVTTMRVASWQYRTLLDPVTSEIPTPTGCENLKFSPWLEVKPAVSQAATPSGYQVTLQLGQNDDPATPRTPNLKDAVVTLPKGVAISPSVANGLEACTDAQLAINSAADETCPPASKIGDAVLESPVLDHPVNGVIYAGSQLSSDPASGDMFRIFLTATDSGLKVKLRGQVSVDPQTGQITARFLENPDLPVEKLTLNLKGGDRAPLTTPSNCGEHTTNSSFTSWGGQSVQGSSTMKIDAGCGTRGFNPGFSAGTANPVAGDFSPFTLRVTRPDGQQNISSIETTLPKGLLAKLAGIPLCGDAQASSGDCPAASQVGTAIVGAGGGSTPVYVPQPGRPTPAAYLAGPYKNAPYSLVVKVPAQAGPFDLGTVTVRNALHIDPVTTQVTAKSDPLPQIVKGVPIAYRDIRVEVDKPGFTLNPTSCEPSRVNATIGSSQVASANLSDRFQVADCASLAFSPHLKIKVSGPTKRAKYTKLRAELKAPPGQANIGRASVALPHSIFLAQEHIKTICTRVQYAAKACPAGSVYGWARAFTPLLDQPLEGPVYLRSSNNPLPDLIASLDGAIHVDLAGRIDSVNGGIRTTFEGVPDAPVSKFVLSMKGGKKSLLVNSRNLCARVNRATVQLDGQNGKAHDFRPAVGNDCGKAKKKRAKGKKRR
jgi:hypothetical protein